jgi:hypothetical protein
MLASISSVFAQRPSAQDVTAIVERARQKGLAYTTSLPDFLATEIIRRYSGSMRDGYGGQLLDILTVHLNYLQHREDHKLMLVDGKPTNRPFATLEGTVSSGEFGATLSAIFDPATQTAFRWQNWKTIRGHMAAVIRYDVAGPNSHYRLGSVADGRTVTADVGYHGVLEIDGETGEIFYLEYLADRLPESLHLTYASTKVDYALAGIAGRDYLLPSHSETVMGNSTTWARNVVDFRDYHKFTADSNIDFGPAK